jgi:hypothetical protein
LRCSILYKVIESLKVIQHFNIDLLKAISYSKAKSIRSFVFF